MPFEFGFFNEGVCFLVRHCGRRCCALFLIWIYKVFKTRIVFPMKVIVFWSQTFWKLIFQWKSFFGFRHCGRRCCAFFSHEIVRFLRLELFFQWKCLFFWFQTFWKWIFNKSVCYFGFRHCGAQCWSVFFEVNL